MELGVLDYIILTMTLCGVIVGLFIGLSGAVAFLVGSVAAGFAGRLGWPLSAHLFEAGWSRMLAVIVFTLVVFWIVRLLVRKTVHGAVAQPGDSIFGALVAGFSAFAVALAALWGLAHLGLADFAAQSVIFGKVFSSVG